MDLKAELPNPDNQEQWKQWWQDNGQQWFADLRAVMIAHRNIGHDWQLTKQQQEKLQQYYDSNLLLVQCLNSDCYVTKETRREIEDTLLLPMKK
ncbi:MAG: hypothetical protein F6K09_40005 [Merismopedia sp. SIO2A8]|nr:hypothetical protein [Merismopedia sp. SIO2A8]